MNQAQRAFPLQNKKAGIFCIPVNQGGTTITSSLAVMRGTFFKEREYERETEVLHHYADLLSQR